MQDLKYANLDYMADLFNICPRALQKRLAKESICFKDLLLEERLSRCMILLEEDTPASIIYEKLGFTDVNSLYRAYHHWTGENLGSHMKLLNK